MVQVAEETHGGILLRPYPKSRAGVGTVPLPGFLLAALRELDAAAHDPDPRKLVFCDRAGRPAGETPSQSALDEDEEGL